MSRWFMYDGPEYSESDLQRVIALEEESAEIRKGVEGE
jgi:hypothetical protein